MTARSWLGCLPLVAAALLLVASFVTYLNAGAIEGSDLGLAAIEALAAWLIAGGWALHQLGHGQSRTAFVGSAGILLLTSVLWLAAQPANERPELGQSIADQVMAKQSGTEVQLNLKPDTSWATGYLFMGYFGPADMDEALGFHWPEGSRTGIETSDEGIVVLVADGRVVAWSRIPAETLLEFPDGYATFSPANSRFHVGQRYDHRLICLPHQPCN